MLYYDKDKLIKEIRRHEGYRDVPYFDSEGILTIGIGHALGRVPVDAATQRAMEVTGVMDKPWPDELLEQLFMGDLEVHENELVKLALEKGLPLERLSDVQQRALINMVFNMGPTRLGLFRKMWAALVLGDYEDAAREALDSRWARQVGRRSREVAKMLRGEQS